MNSKIAELKKQLQSVPKDSTERVDALTNLAWEIWPLEPKLAEQAAYEGFALAKKLNYAKGVAYAKINLGMLHYLHAEIEQAMEHLLDAIQWFEENDEKEGEANANHALSLLYWAFGDFQRGFDAISKTLRIYEDLDNCDGRGWAYNALGNFHYDLKDYEQSREHFKHAYGIFKDTRNRIGQARALNGIGNAYHLIGEHKKALAYQNKSLKIHQGEKNIVGESKTLNDIGLVFQSLNNFGKALAYHTKSLEMRRKIGYPQGETSNLLDIGNIYLQQQDFDSALEVFQNALDLSKKIKAKVKMSSAHLALYKIYKERGEYEKALEHHEKYHEIHEEVFHEDTDKKLKNLKTAYQVEASKKEAEIYRLKNVELKAKNDELQQMLNKLNVTQAQLIQSGKMAALGQLTAGIIHEINTPIGAIKSATDVITRVNIRALQILTANGKTTSAQKQKQLKSVFDILKQNTTITSQGTERILNIVRNLKNFTKLDSANFQKMNIHEGLDSTLALLEHEIKDKIKIRKNYGNIPEIYGYPSELNQVFMNLVLNGLQAISETGTLNIRTSCKDGHVTIKFADSGKGIPQEELARLFEPGFTEKDARVQMRTGLFTAYNIILKHNGDIKVKSRLGKGSTFTISLPEDLRK